MPVLYVIVVLLLLLPFSLLVLSFLLWLLF